MTGMTAHRGNTALRAPFGFLAAAVAMVLLTPAARADERAPLKVAPGRVVFTQSDDGAWGTFGLRGDRILMKSGGVIVFAQAADASTVTLADAASGKTASLLENRFEIQYEGARNGARKPSPFPDDDDDGQLDEDPLDGVDNDRDSRVDEDFAAIGDEMTVAVFAPRKNAAVAIRQEAYGWSLAHIDGMVASTVVVRNTGAEPHAGVRVAFRVETEDRMTLEHAPQIENSRRQVETGDVSMHPVVLRGGSSSFGLLLFVPRAAQAATVGWDVQLDERTLVVTSSDLGDLAPGAELVCYVALVALPGDDLKAARAIHAAARTVLGDGTSRFLPPPVPVTSVAGTERTAQISPLTGGGHAGIDPFWNQTGRLEETLVVGSPNPFRDAIAIDYEVPERVVDEDGVEHTLTGYSIATSVKVYNVAGRLVTTLVDTEHAPGRYRTGWTARNDTGSLVASGVYYVKLTIGQRSVTQRMVQLK